jgi:hypothetical protein
MQIKASFTVKPAAPVVLNPTRLLTRSLVGCWLLNEGAGRIAHDISGHHYDGLFSGEPTWSPDRFGYGVEFDGNDDWITMGDCLDLGTDDVTVFAIMKYSAAAQPDEWSGLHFAAIAGKGHLDTAGRGYGLSINSNNQIYWQVRNQSTYFYVASDGALNDGQYHSATGVCDRDSTTGVRLYIDGVQQSTTADPTSVDGNDLSGSRAFAIGSRQEEGGTWFWDFAGRIVAVYVWKRALIDAEIRQVQRDPFALFGPRSIFALLAPSIPALTDCSGSVMAQATLSAHPQVIRNIAGSIYGITSASTTAQVRRDVSGISSASTLLTAALKRTRIVAVAGTVSPATALHGTLSRLTPHRSSAATPAIGAFWSGEVLFNGMTSAASKLGTALTRGWFWMRRSGCMALYGGTTLGQVDVQHFVCVIDARNETFSLPVHLSPPTDSSYCFLVQRFNLCGEQERTTTAAVTLRTTPNGQLELPSPNIVSGLKAEQIAGNRFRFAWLYCPLDQGAPPAQFNVYWDGGTGHMDLENPIAVIPYKGYKFYHYDSGTLTIGRYTFLVRARGASMVESMSPAGMVCQVKNLSCKPVSILAAQSI